MFLGEKSSWAKDDVKYPIMYMQCTLDDLSYQDYHQEWRVGLASVRKPALVKAGKLPPLPWELPLLDMDQVAEWEVFIVTHVLLTKWSTCSQACYTDTKG